MQVEVAEGEAVVAAQVLLEEAVQVVLEAAVALVLHRQLLGLL
tara:strand:+ start:415 stop:543 length:129 start_codon:yes stop_codon:yes gene_type:complete